MTLVLRDVSLESDGMPVLYDVSMTLHRGSMNVLLGATLAGKTTLMRLMAGLETPTRGKILIDGEDTKGIPVRRRSVAMVYQQFVNYPSLSIYENIASPLRVARLPKEEIDNRVRSMAALLGIDDLLDRSPNDVSGGQQQRTAIARAMVKGAAVVLLDEPLANLDYKLREELREELPRILAETNSILVYATTEPLEALQLGGNTAALYEGRIVQFGPTAKIYHHPDNLKSAQVFSDPPLNEITVVKQGEALRFDDFHTIQAEGRLRGLPDGPYTLGFRSEVISLGKPWPNSMSVAGEVWISEISGSESFVHVDTALGRFVCAAAGVTSLGPGHPVTVQIDADRVFVFNENGGVVSCEGEKGRRG